jgi:hypothetical protein
MCIHFRGIVSSFFSQWRRLFNFYTFVVCSRHVMTYEARAEDDDGGHKSARTQHVVGAVVRSGRVPDET